MPRPRRCRRVVDLPNFAVFKPAGVPKRSLSEVVLTVDEFEALRLADYECLYQQQAAESMAVSRQTFGRIVESARRKVAKALVEGCAMRIEGGDVRMAEMAETRSFECGQCGHAWEVPFGTERPAACPACGSENVRRQVEVPADDAGAGPVSESGAMPSSGSGFGRGASGRGGGQRHRRGRRGRRGGE